MNSNLKFTLQKNPLKVYNIAVNNLDMHRNRNRKKQTWISKENINYETYR